MSASNKEIVQKVNDAFSAGNIEAFLDYCTEDVQWTMVGKPAWVGKQVIRDFMKSENPGSSAPQMTVQNVIADGDMVASDGTMSMTNADGTEYQGAFCDVYRFLDGKIHEMHSYIVDL